MLTLLVVVGLVALGFAATRLVGKNKVVAEAKEVEQDVVDEVKKL